MKEKISPEVISLTVHQNMPVITTELLAQLYGTESVRIRQNHTRNDDRFIIGKHYFLLEGDELREFKHRVSQSYSVKISRNVRSLILWTERGAARHAKMLETDQAWEVFERLEDCYFSQRNKANPPAVGCAPMSLDILLAIRDDKVAFIKQHQAGTLLTVDEALSLLKAKGWLVMPREELAGKLMEL